MSNEITLTQLVAEIAQLRRQLETVNQRLDMIYGAVTRLADAQNPSVHKPAQQKQPQATPASELQLRPDMMMNPGSMLDSLREYAVNRGLDISPETVERLKSHSRSNEVEDDQK